MRSLRLMAAFLALALVAVSCGDDEAAEPADEQQVTTTTQSVAAVVDEPSETTTPTTSPTLPPTTLPEATETAPEPVEEPVTEELPAIDVAAPVAPSNIRCVASANEGEVLVEFNALPDPSAVSKIRVYAGPSGQRPLPLNGEFNMGQVNTAGSRWSVPARGVPAGITLDLAATSFNLADRESGWYIAQGVYRGPGQPCGTDDPGTDEPATDEPGTDEPGTDDLPPPTGTAGFGAIEIEPAPGSP